ncbi:MAG: hypothetical protein ACQCN4_08735 [Candidatus Bathyarchaeia archaeon]
MAGLTNETPDGIFGETNCKSSLNEDASIIDTDSSKPLIFIRYRDHVFYNRASAVLMQPQTREAVGWLIYEAEQYIILSWDRDAGPPTLHGGDPKASGLVLLKSDIIRCVKFRPQPLLENYELNLKSKQSIEEAEYAFRPSERKTQKTKGEQER